MYARGSALALTVVLALSSSALAGQREIPATAASLAEDVVAASKKTVAVVDFTDLQGNVTELGRFVAEEVALGLVTARKGLSVVDRTHLKVLMQENRLDSTGVIDPATARKIGQVLGVEALITGTITPFSDTVRIVAKILDTTTARIVGAASVDVSKNRTIEELLARDIRPGAGSAAPATTVPSGATATGSGDVFENGSMRVRVAQLGVSADNRRASVSLIIENSAKETLYLARNGEPSLADDAGTGWRAVGEVAGLPFSSSPADREDKFAAIQPGGRMTVVMNFFNNNTGDPGRVYSVSASAVQFTPSGQRRVAIGIANITPAAKPPTAVAR